MKKRGISKRFIISSAILLAVLFSILFISSISLISALDFSIGNSSHYLDKSYGPGENITGWINISFRNISSEEVLVDSRGNSIKLSKLLNSSQAYSYFCIPIDCGKGYSEKNSAEKKNFSLNNGEEKLIGLKITGEVTGIESIKFDLESNAEEDCYNQIKIDFLNDGSYEKGNTRLSSGNCNFLKRYGCFNFSKTTQPKSIGNTPYCQRIKLTESSGFKLGAWIKRESGNSDVIMSLHNLLGEDTGINCIIKNISTEGSETFCNVSYLLTKEEEYYICISLGVGSGIYETRGYDDVKGCGFYGNSINSEIASYSIFAEGIGFGKVGNISITNELPNQEYLSGIIWKHISEKYNGECSDSCIIPIRFKSEKNQNIEIRNLSLKYETSTGLSNEKNFYEISETPSKINSNFGKLPINGAGFKTPAIYGNYTFILKLKDSNIISEKVFVEKVPIIISISPTSTVSELPTEFTLKTNSSSEITKYYWKFGDGEEEISSVNKITHDYNSTGIYTLQVEVTDSNSRTSKKDFIIVVGSPKEVINNLLNKYKSNINSIKANLSKLDSFTKKQIEDALKIEEIDTSLKKLQRDYESSITENDFNLVLKELIKLKVPNSIKLTGEGENLLFFTDKEKINLDVLSKIRNEKYDASKVGEYKEAILMWNQENIGIRVSFKEYSSVYDFENEQILNVFQVKLTKKGETSYYPYLVIKNLDSLTFGEDYLEKEESGYKYIELKDNEKTYEFSTKEKIIFSDLPVFVSPELSRLPTIQPITISKKSINFGLLFLWLILIFIIGIMAYIILQEWYKRRYENYLFRNQTNLYNLVNYIDASRKRGMTEEEISSKLKKAGWTLEQINYAIKKYFGKRTGMLEIPIEKILKLFRRKEIIIPQKPNQPPVNNMPSQRFPFHNNGINRNNFQPRRF